MIAIEEYNHISDIRLAEMQRHYDKCKCKQCQERAELMQKIMDYRHENRNGDAS